MDILRRIRLLEKAKVVLDSGEVANLADYGDSLLKDLREKEELSETKDLLVIEVLDTRFQNVTTGGSTPLILLIIITKEGYVSFKRIGAKTIEDPIKDMLAEGTIYKTDRDPTEYNMEVLRPTVDDSYAILRVRTKLPIDRANSTRRALKVAAKPVDPSLPLEPCTMYFPFILSIPIVKGKPDKRRAVIPRSSIRGFDVYAGLVDDDRDEPADVVRMLALPDYIVVPPVEQEEPATTEQDAQSEPDEPVEQEIPSVEPDEPPELIFAEMEEARVEEDVDDMRRIDLLREGEIVLPRGEVLILPELASKKELKKILARNQAFSVAMLDDNFGFAEPGRVRVIIFDIAGGAFQFIADDADLAYLREYAVSREQNVFISRPLSRDYKNDAFVPVLRALSSDRKGVADMSVPVRMFPNGRGGLTFQNEGQSAWLEMSVRLVFPVVLDATRGRTNEPYNVWNKRKTEPGTNLLKSLPNGGAELTVPEMFDMIKQPKGKGKRSKQAKEDAMDVEPPFVPTNIPAAVEDEFEVDSSIVDAIEKEPAIFDNQEDDPTDESAPADAKSMLSRINLLREGRIVLKDGRVVDIPVLTSYDFGKLTDEKQVLLFYNLRDDFELDGYNGFALDTDGNIVRVAWKPDPRWDDSWKRSERNMLLYVPKGEKEDEKAFKLKLLGLIATEESDGDDTGDYPPIRVWKGIAQLDASINVYIDGSGRTKLSPIPGTLPSKESTEILFPVVIDQDRPRPGTMIWRTSQTKAARVRMDYASNYDGSLTVQGVVDKIEKKKKRPPKQPQLPPAPMPPANPTELVNEYARRIDALIDDRQITLENGTTLEMLMFDEFDEQDFASSKPKIVLTLFSDRDEEYGDFRLRWVSCVIDTEGNIFATVFPDTYKGFGRGDRFEETIKLFEDEDGSYLKPKLIAIRSKVDGELETLENLNLPKSLIKDGLVMKEEYPLRKIMPPIWRALFELDVEIATYEKDGELSLDFRKGGKKVMRRAKIVHPVSISSDRTKHAGSNIFTADDFEAATKVPSPEVWFVSYSLGELLKYAPLPPIPNLSPASPAQASASVDDIEVTVEISPESAQKIRYMYERRDTIRFVAAGDAPATSQPPFLFEALWSKLAGNPHVDLKNFLVRPDLLASTWRNPPDFYAPEGSMGITVRALTEAEQGRRPGDKRGRTEYKYNRI